MKHVSWPQKLYYMRYIESGTMKSEKIRKYLQRVDIWMDKMFKSSTITTSPCVTFTQRFTQIYIAYYQQCEYTRDRMQYSVCAVKQFHTINRKIQHYITQKYPQQFQSRINAFNERKR